MFGSLLKAIATAANTGPALRTGANRPTVVLVTSEPVATNVPIPNATMLKMSAASSVREPISAMICCQLPSREGRAQRQGSGSRLAAWAFSIAMPSLASISGARGQRRTAATARPPP